MRIVRTDAVRRSHQPAPCTLTGGSLVDYVKDLEREAIMKALRETRDNKTAAAKKLGITCCALRYELKKLGID